MEKAQDGRRANIMVSDMRYVIGILLLAGGIVYDAVYHDGHYLNLAVKGLRGILTSLGVG